MKWSNPPIIKIYEAIWAIADDRIEILKPQGFFDDLWTIKAKVYSSSKNKYYEVEYDEKTNQIMTNDNWSYWKWYLWYPAITLLLKLWKLELIEKYSLALKDIKWKDINTANNNDFDKTMDEIDNIIVNKWLDLNDFKSYLNNILETIDKLWFEQLWKKKLPPKGY